MGSDCQGERLWRVRVHVREQERPCSPIPQVRCFAAPSIVDALRTRTGRDNRFDSADSSKISCTMSAVFRVARSPAHARRPVHARTLGRSEHGRQTSSSSSIVIRSHGRGTIRTPSPPHARSRLRQLLTHRRPVVQAIALVSIPAGSDLEVEGTIHAVFLGPQ